MTCHHQQEFNQKLQSSTKSKFATPTIMMTMALLQLGVDNKLLLVDAFEMSIMIVMRLVYQLKANQKKLLLDACGISNFVIMTLIFRAKLMIKSMAVRSQLSNAFLIR